MELTISQSSQLRVSSFISQRCKTSNHVNRLIPTKPTTKLDIKSSNLPLKCSTNKLILPIKLCEDSRFPKSSLFDQHKRNSILACANLEFAGSDPLIAEPEAELAAPANSIFAKVLRFGSILFKFVRPYSMIQVIIASICLFARVLVENPQLFEWSLLLKAFPGLIAMIQAHVFNNGINQIFDVEIDRVNKPYLPIPAGDLSLKQAWFLMISSVLWGLMIFRLMNADFITTCFYCFGILLALLYNAPPFRFKGSSVATIITIPLILLFSFNPTTIVNNIGVLYATMASLGLPFRWSPSIVFITIFGSLFFAAVCILKDIPDVEGDMKHNIRTFAAIFGAKNMALLGTGILLVNYIGAIAVTIYMPQAFKRYVMLPAHSIFAVWLLFQAKKLDKVNYVKEGSINFYQFIWKLLTLEFLLFPFM